MNDNIPATPATPATQATDSSLPEGSPQAAADPGRDTGADPSPGEPVIRYPVQLACAILISRSVAESFGPTVTNALIQKIESVSFTCTLNTEDYVFNLMLSGFAWATEEPEDEPAGSAGESAVEADTGPDAHARTAGAAGADGTEQPERPEGRGAEAGPQSPSL
jgi:hypothetical protein